MWKQTELWVHCEADDASQVREDGRTGRRAVTVVAAPTANRFSTCISRCHCTYSASTHSPEALSV